VPCNDHDDLLWKKKEEKNKHIEQKMTRFFVFLNEKSEVCDCCRPFVT